MSNALSILCPGQGAQTVGMGRDFHAASPAARALFQQANEILGFDIQSICFTGPLARLNQTDISQPAIYLVSIASYHAALEAGHFEHASVTACAGLSLGEYTALHLAGAFDFATGLKLVAARGKLMQQAAESQPGGMVAIIGADEAAAQEICRSAAAPDVLVLANYNAPGQIVLSGSKAACDRALAAAEKAGFRATSLVVAGAFHSPLMQSAADAMRGELAAVTIKAHSIPVWSNVTAQPHTDPDAVVDLLVQQIVQPVRWSQTMADMIRAADGAGRFIELAPGRTLAGLARRIDRRATVESVPTPKPKPQTLQPSNPQTLETLNH
jgi:[acyl-carrier-protein] S-malonyltransferase